jgi:hypothetical protein
MMLYFEKMISSILDIEIKDPLATASSYVVGPSLNFILEMNSWIATLSKIKKNVLLP